jgi:hypothetical protein
VVLKLHVSHAKHHIPTSKKPSFCTVENDKPPVKPRPPPQIHFSSHSYLFLKLRRANAILKL